MTSALTQDQRSQAMDDAVQPLTSACAGIPLTLSTVSAHLSAAVAPGDYVVVLDKTAGICWVAWAASVTIPANAAAAAAGTFAVRDGDVIRAPTGNTDFAAILSGTGNTGSLCLNPLL